MSLANPSIPYITIRDSLITLFRNNMATLNTNLTNTFTANDQIKKGDITVTPIFNTRYPSILIKALRKTEDFYSFGGNTGRKMADISFLLSGICRSVKSSQEDDDQVIYLTQNIESVLRDNIRFDNNILYSQPTDVDWAGGVPKKGTYVAVVLMDIVCTVEVK